MLIDWPAKKSMALMLTAGAIVAGTQISAQAAGAQGNPPALRQATSSTRLRVSRVTRGPLRHMRKTS